MSSRAPLGTAALAQLADRDVERPAYPRRLQHRICHLGAGAFHRAHQAHYLHDLLQLGLADGWGICAIGLKPFDRNTLAALGRQDNLYSHWQAEGTQRRGSVVGSIMERIDATADSAPAVEVLADAATRIVSLTVTEAGYCLTSDGVLDETAPDVVRDLLGGGSPRSTPGVIVKALEVRRAAGLGGLTLQSCDNLIDNGNALRSAVLGFAELSNSPLTRWIEKEVSFPSSMVDRITPAMTPLRREELSAQLGLTDEAPVLCEPWRQWVLEDSFVNGRPPWEKAGAMITTQVKRYEDMKVGLLNGGHSAISHLGLMLGHTQVHAALADTRVRDWLAAYMQEAAEVLQPAPGIHLGEYQIALIQRFSNPAIEDRLQRLTQDTSAKYQQALLPLLLRRLRQGRPAARFAAALALWIAWLERLRTDGPARDVYQDLHKDRLIQQAGQAWANGNAAEFLAAVFPQIPADATAFRQNLDLHLRGLRNSLAGHLPLLLKPDY